MTTGELFISHSIDKLKQMAALIRACLDKLNEEQVWARDADTENSIANLVLHLCGNVRQWIGWSIGGQPDVRRRDEEFAPAAHLGKVTLMEKLALTIDDAVSILASFPPERLTDPVPTQDGERYALHVIYQVVGHFQQHTGQIIFATKQFTGEDLKFYTPPKKSA